MKKISTIIVVILLLVIGIASALFFFTKEKETQKNVSSDTQTKEVPIVNVPYGDWRWISMIDNTGQTITPKDPEKFILTLSPEGKLTSTTDCNNISGSFVVNDTIINIGPLTLTEMGCTGEILESIYVSSLSSISSYTITNTQIVFNLLQNKGSMTFSKK